jgi:hypothetical protein
MIAGVARVSSADKLVHAEFHTPPRVTVKTAVLAIAWLQLLDLGRKWALAESVFRGALVRAP